tara:strand:+ start:473 stop:985 length:513 start_codon:yes stop_codon:yes gene_type:complete
MYKILYVPDPKLRQSSEKLKKITLKDIEISKKMTEIMLKAPGVGLAANQIGILKQIITINISDENNKIKKMYTLFNPKIIYYSEKKIMMEEGCLSLPQQYADIERPEEIVVQYLNENNKKLEEKKVGYEARVLQHEIDHLHGKLFVDYLSSLKRNKLMKRVQKLKKIGEI